MSIFHLAAQVIGRSSGRSATAAAAYRAAARIEEARTGQVFDFTRKGGVRETFILAPATSPEWMRDRSQLWNAVEAAEKRKDSQLAREIEVSLPFELSHEQRRALLIDFIRDEFVSLGMVADCAMHAPGKQSDKRNEHAHIMLTLRQIEADGFGNKVRGWNNQELVEKWRESWARRVNSALLSVGIDQHVDHRSHARQAVASGHDIELANLGTVHLGPQASAAERRGIHTVPGNLNREVKIINLELALARKLAEQAGQRRVVHFCSRRKGGNDMCVTMGFDVATWRSEAEQHAREHKELSRAFKRKFGTENSAEARRMLDMSLPRRQAESFELRFARQRMSHAQSNLADATSSRAEFQARGLKIKPTIEAIRRVNFWRKQYPVRAFLHDLNVWKNEMARMPDWLLGKDGYPLPKESLFDSIDPAELQSEWDQLKDRCRKIEIEILRLEQQLASAEKNFDSAEFVEERNEIDQDYSRRQTEHVAETALLEAMESADSFISAIKSELSRFQAAELRVLQQSPDDDDGDDAVIRLVGPTVADAMDGLEELERTFVFRKAWKVALAAQAQADELEDECEDGCSTPPAAGGTHVLTFKPSLNRREGLRPRG